MGKNNSYLVSKAQQSSASGRESFVRVKLGELSGQRYIHLSFTLRGQKEKMALSRSTPEP